VQKEKRIFSFILVVFVTANRHQLKLVPLLPPVASSSPQSRGPET
jgi:hypothetical protein